MARKQPVTPWTLYVDESGSFTEVEDDVVVCGLLVRDDIPGLSIAEVRQSLESAVPGFPWPWHASLINNASWVAFVLGERQLSASHPDADIRWLAEAVRRVNDGFADRFGDRYLAIRTRLASDGEAGQIKLNELADFEGLLREAYPAELEAIRAHSQRARAAVKQFANALAIRAASTGDATAALLLFSSETVRGDARSEPESVLGDRRYFRLLEVLVDRAAATLARRGGAHELSLDVSERRLIDPLFRRPAKQLTQHVDRELSALRAKWRHSVRIVARAVTPFDRHIGMRFVVADFAANRGRRALRRGAVPLKDTETDVETHLALAVRSGTPPRSHLAASGDAYALCQLPGSDGPAALSYERPRRRWACEQAWEWCAR